MSSARHSVEAGVVEWRSGGRARTFVIEGQAGFGKTRLLTQVARLAGDIGAVVASRRATTLDRIAGLSTLTMTLGGSGPTAEAVAGLSELGHNPLLALDRLAARLDTVAQTRALFIGIDDFDLADEVTALALQTLVPALKDAPVCWVLTRRPATVRSGDHAAADAALDVLLADGAHRVELGALGVDGIRELCTDVLGAEPEPDLLQHLEFCHGDPLLVEQTLRDLLDSDTVAVADGRATLVSGAAPTERSASPKRVVDAVAWRLSLLSATARRVLEAAAVIARPATLHELSQVAGITGAELVDPVGEAVRSGMFVDGFPTLTFRSEVVRAAVYAQLTPTARTALHQAAGTAARAGGSGAVEVAEHLMSSGTCDPEALVELLRADDLRIADQSGERACALVHRGLQMSPATAPGVSDLATEGVLLLLRCGRVAEARELGETYLRSPATAQQEVDLLLATGAALRRCDDPCAMVEHAGRTLTRPDLSAGLRTDVRAVDVYGRALREERDVGPAVAEVLAHADELDRPHAAAIALLATATLDRAACRLEGAVAAARRAVVAADRGDRFAGCYHPRWELAASLVGCDLTEEADAVLDQCAQDPWSGHRRTVQPRGHLLRAATALANGEIADAATAAQDGLAGIDPATSGEVGALLLAKLVEIDVRRGDLAAAQGHLRTAEAVSVTPGGHAELRVAWRRILVELAGGHPRRAARIAATMQHAVAAGAVGVYGTPSVVSGLVRLAMFAAAAARGADELVAGAAAAAAANPSLRHLRASAVHAAALVGDDIEGLHEAAELFRQCRRPLDRAAALADAAAAERRSGRVEAAREGLRDARAVWIEAGAIGDVRWDFAALRDPTTDDPSDPTDQPRRQFTLPSGDRDGTASPTDVERRWAELTPAEMKVAEYVAEGLTNRAVASRLTVSPHTVDSHLRRAFAKMGVTSRVELTRLIVALHPPAPGNLPEPA